MSHLPPPDSHLRLFYAVPLAPPLRAGAREVQEQIGRVRARVRWVEPDNLHFTVKFLGDTPRSSLPALSTVGLQVSSRHEAFELCLAQAGAFGRPSSPSAIWIGCSRGAEGLCALASDLDRSLAAAGLCAAEARPFRAHLTIGRYKDRRSSPELAQAISEAAETDLGGFRVERFALLSSELTRGGPIYTELESFALQAGAGTPPQANSPEATGPGGEPSA